MRRNLHPLLIISVHSVAIAGLSAAAWAQDTTKPVQQDEKTLLAPPTAPLDGRVSADKVTEYDPSPLPQQVVLPKPAEFRLASSASDLPISPEHYAKAMASLRRGLDYREL